MLATPALLAQTNDLDLIIRYVLAGLGHGIHAGPRARRGRRVLRVPGLRARATSGAVSTGSCWRAPTATTCARRSATATSRSGCGSTPPPRWPSRAAAIAGLDKLWYARTAARLPRRDRAAPGRRLRPGRAAAAAACSSRRPRAGRARCTACWPSCRRRKPAGELPPADTLRASLHFARSPSLVFAVSDFLDFPSPHVRSAAAPAPHAARRARAVPADARPRCDASFAVDKAYRDPEQGDGVFRFGAEAQAEYRQRREEHFAARDGATWRKHDIRALTACIEEPLARCCAAGCARRGAHDQPMVAGAAGPAAADLVAPAEARARQGAAAGDRALPAAHRSAAAARVALGRPLPAAAALPAAGLPSSHGWPIRSCRGAATACWWRRAPTPHGRSSRSAQPDSKAQRIDVAGRSVGVAARSTNANGRRDARAAGAGRRRRCRPRQPHFRHQRRAAHAGRAGRRTASTASRSSASAQPNGARCSPRCDGPQRYVVDERTGRQAGTDHLGHAAGAARRPCARRCGGSATPPRSPN